MQLDKYGSEARFTAALGTRKEFTAEYFKVLDGAHRWFVAPGVALRQRPVAVYGPDGAQLGEYDVISAQGALTFGRQFGSIGELRLGFEGGAAEAEGQIGVLAPKTLDFQSGQLFAQAAFDTVDNPYFPTRGGRGLLRYTAALTELGDDRDFQQIRGSGSFVTSFGRSTLWFNVEGGDTVQGRAPLPSLFSLGGPFSFPGYAIDELTGQTYGAARLMYRNRVAGNGDGLLRIPVFVGATLVTGNTWATSNDAQLSDLRFGANLFVGTDTLFGPVFLTFGAADEGRTAFYVFVGRPF
jgi:NTE family protein